MNTYCFKVTTLRVVWFSVFMFFGGPRVGAQETCIVPKCCAPGETIPATGRGCHNSSLEFEPVFWNGVEAVIPKPDEVLNVIIGDPCAHGKFRLEPEEDSSDEFHILCNGSLLVPFQSDQLYGVSQYCLEAFPSKDGVQTVTLPLLCFPPPPPPPTIFEKIAMATYPMGLLISVPFLLQTIFVFMQPALRDTQAKSLICHCCSLMVAYLSLATVMLVSQSLPQGVCVTLAFVIQFSFVSCFFWLNVLCIDTWWRITRKPSHSPHQEHLRFLWYSVYAWSIPLIFVIVTMVMELTPIVPDAYLKPNFGTRSCWFRSREAAFPYFYAPVGLLLLSNVVLFLNSLGGVRSAREQLAEEEQSLNKELQSMPYSRAQRRIDMFKQSAILFVVMGLNWTLELLSYFVGGPIEMWILTDTLNSLQGVIIYFVFVDRVARVKRMAGSSLLCTRLKPARRLPDRTSLDLES